MKTKEILLAGMAILLASSTALAEASPFRLQVATTSGNDGFGEATVQLYERQASVGRDARAQDMLNRFESRVGAIKTGAYDSVQTGDNHILVNGSGWLLDVRGDGDWVRYWNVEYAEGPENTPVPLSQKPSLASLESVGRSFVGSALGDLVKLGPNEKLEPWYTAHQIGVTEDIGSERVQLVYASKIVFTRVIDGVPVLGPGSKVVVHIAADGTVTGFDVDWSTFKPTGQTQKALPVADIHSRAMMLASEKAAASNRIEDRFECGFYDTGARLANRAAPLQIACLSSYRVLHDGGAHGVVDVVPASAGVQVDAEWAESGKFARPPL